MDKVFFEPADLLLERLDLFPAVEGPAIVGAQTGDDGFLGLGEVDIDLLELFACGQLGLEALNLAGDALAAHVLLALLLGERGLARGGVSELVDERGLAALFRLSREVVAEAGKAVRLLAAQLLELGRQALLVRELLRLRPRRVCLGGGQRGVPWPVRLPLTSVFFCIESTRPLEKRTGWSLRAMGQPASPGERR